MRRSPVPAAASTTIQCYSTSKPAHSMHCPCILSACCYSGRVPASAPSRKSSWASGQTLPGLRPPTHANKCAGAGAPGPPALLAERPGRGVCHVWRPRGGRGAALAARTLADHEAAARGGGRRAGQQQQGRRGIGCGLTAPGGLTDPASIAQQLPFSMDGGWACCGSRRARGTTLRFICFKAVVSSKREQDHSVEARRPPAHYLRGR